MQITIDPQSKTPLYRQIYLDIREKITSGTIPEGQRLPATRVLANSLTVARNTVESAYRQLAVEGYLESRVGSGYTVQPMFGAGFATLGEAQAPRRVAPAPDVRDADEDCDYNFPFDIVNPADFPYNAWRKSLLRAFDELSLGQLTIYPEPKGNRGLRSALCEYLGMSRSVPCTPEQIVIFAGTAQALDMIAKVIASYSGSTDRTIAMEDPGYYVTKKAFAQNGYHVEPIRVGEEGLEVDQLEKCQAQVVYVTPSHQFPLGVVMPIQRRSALLDWAKQHDGIIIEDDYDSELRYSTRPIPAICGLGDSDRVIYIGTFSKVLAPGLRVSYAVLPPRLLPAYETIFGTFFSAVSTLEQKTLELFMRSDAWESHLRRMRAANKKRHDKLMGCLHELLGDAVALWGGDAGLHVVLESRTGLSEQDMVSRALERSVRVYPLSPLCARQDNRAKGMVMVGFGCLSEHEIVEGVKRLAEAWLPG